MIYKQNNTNIQLYIHTYKSSTILYNNRQIIIFVISNIFFPFHIIINLIVFIELIFIYWLLEIKLFKINKNFFSFKNTKL